MSARTTGRARAARGGRPHRVRKDEGMTLPNSRPTALSPQLLDGLARWFDGAAPVAPSLSWALFDRSGVLVQHGIGEHRRDGAAPNSGTVHRIASMSKSFEAAAVLILRDRGLLDLDDRLGAHVPEFADPVDASGRTMPVTIRMLLSNCSGLPEDNGWADHVMAMPRGEFLELIGRGLCFTERPGEVYQYSNIGFWLLGVVVENVTGEDFVAFATRTLLEPLGLEQTRYDSSYPDGTDLAQGFSSFDDGATWTVRPVTGAGVGACAASMFSTVGDIARWSAWLSSAFDGDDGPAEDDAVLSRASRREMQRGLTPVPALSPRAADGTLDGSAYGFGLVIEHDVRFGSIAHHSGGLPGWSSNMRWHLESGLGAVIFATANGAKLAAAATGLLRAALEETVPPARTITLHPSTLAAAAAVEAAIVDSGDISRAQAPGSGVLFSPNLLSDVPAEVRARRLAAAIAEIGGLADNPTARPLRERLLWSASAAQLAFSLPGCDGELECRLETTPTIPALLQRLEIVVRASQAAQAPVVRSYRPRLD
ncbi:2', 3'-cyclic nucleotide 2'-phosphodiesterase [Rathayibacter rathayi]|uniref:2', 3'-cyclic nucleotide 2'-phosphodiesterase n=2 Tax=Rathayibacter rathayi TaxID=33887 RepID=A0ABX5AEY2_RATRA|nr:2', 3'-cyclic nucleotide 2'-phosphodiesterase [Rathayibacter rathayi]PPH79526.1 2', 3'-cyclic nucleotide 2'-phosphodiesterase [Rathayibacter rathayi]PPI63156.1 2', 3'-cyclic nucleotide 2'-phosphodiesterase [Rathayibacter rathayi]